MLLLNPNVAAIISAIIAGGAAVLARKLLFKIKAMDYMVINFLVMGGMLAIFSPWFFRFDLSWASLGNLFLVIAIDLAGNYLYFKTLENTEASVAVPLLSLAPVFTFLVGFLWLQEIVSAATIFFSAAIIVSLVFFSIDLKNFKVFNKHTLIPALLSSLAFGVSAIPSKILLHQLHATNGASLYMVRAVAIAAVGFLCGGSVRQVTSSQFFGVVARGVFVIGQYLLLYYALAHTVAGVAVTLENTAPVFAFVFAVVFLKEKTTFKKIVCSILILILSLLIV